MMTGRYGVEGGPDRQGLRLLDLVLAAVLVPAFGWAGTAPEPNPEPAVVVQVRFVPGGEGPWRRAFERHLVPAIQDAVATGGLRDFAYFESIVPGQAYDFLLVLHADSFAFFDEPRPYPHWAALFRRVGEDEGRRILADMQRWEEAVSVQLVRAHRGRR